jgi:uncharacterized protein YdhG (YjbR/CyaY superfamily)
MSPEFEAYISSFPNQTRSLLTEVYETCKDLMPKAKEILGYVMPCFALKQNVVYFTGFKYHIGFYPTAFGVKAVETELVGLKFSKGAIQFPLDKPVPLFLIQKNVLFWMMEIINQRYLYSRKIRNNFLHEIIFN